MLALIEIKRPKSLFGLLTGVVVLISHLIIMVTGPGARLERAGRDGLLSLNGDYLACALRPRFGALCPGDRRNCGTGLRLELQLAGVAGHDTRVRIDVMARGIRRDRCLREARDDQVQRLGARRRRDIAGREDA